MFKKKSNVALHEEKMSEERNQMYQVWLAARTDAHEVWRPVGL